MDVDYLNKSLMEDTNEMESLSKESVIILVFSLAIVITFSCSVLLPMVHGSRLLQVTAVVLSLLSLAQSELLPCPLVLLSSPACSSEPSLHTVNSLNTPASQARAIAKP